MSTKMTPPEKSRAGEAEAQLPSIAHGRKMLLDFMDSKRPWATCSDAYIAMEQIANYAAFAFRNHLTPTTDDIAALHRDLLRFTSGLKYHPSDYEGPCACVECMTE